MTKIYVDTKFLLDFLISDRQESANARKIVEHIVKEDLEAYVSPLSLLEVFEVLKDQKSSKERKELIEDLLEVFEVVDLDKDVLRTGIYSSSEDLLDALQIACAKSVDAQIMIKDSGDEDDDIKMLTLDMLVKAFDQSV